MSRRFKIIISLSLLFLALILFSYSYYQYQLAPVSNNSSIIKIQIPKNVTGTKIGEILFKQKLIKSKFFFKLYLKLNHVDNLKHGVYDLKQTLDTKAIVGLLVKGTGLTGSEIDLLFREGINMRGIARVIANYTINDEEDVYQLMADESYLDELISEYWFLSEAIKNKEIYYPLEGYLAPNTYRFASERVEVKDIIKAMLKQTDKVLTKYQAEIEASEFTLPEFLTFASIVQGEGRGEKDMPMIAGVFYNRLKQRIPFQSCITNCYATRTDNCVPKKVNRKFDNPYNTYLEKMVGKLPPGPVSNPGEIALRATAQPASHDYLFFCADINHQTYFTKTNTEHERQVSKLKQAKIWPQ